jgi:hypothetical protein
MTLREHQEVFSRNVVILLDEIIKTPGYSVTGGEWWRSETQAWIYSLPFGSELYAISPDGKKHEYEKLVGGLGSSRSLHRSRLAIDLNIFFNGAWMTDHATYSHFGETWKSLHPLNRWGGDYGGDVFHFSMTDGKQKW